MEHDGYIKDVLSGRTIYWCPSYQGYGAYCPRPTDPDEYIYCCNYYYLEADMPSCCRFSNHTGVVYAMFLIGLVSIFLFIFLTCWCCPACPLARKVADNREQRELDS